MACLIRERKGLGACDYDGCDFHHFKSGNIRRGHAFGVGLCAYHHRGHPRDGYRSTEMRAYFGPSLMDGGKAFREAYGSDDELMALQDEILSGA